MLLQRQNTNRMNQSPGWQWVGSKLLSVTVTRHHRLVDSGVDDDNPVPLLRRQTRRVVSVLIFGHNNGLHGGELCAQEDRTEAQTIPWICSLTLHSRHSFAASRLVQQRSICLQSLTEELAVAARFGIGRDFWINLVLTLCGYIPGHGHNFYIQVRLIY